MRFSPLRSLPDHANRAEHSENRGQLHNAATSPVWGGSKFELALHTLDQTAHLPSTGFRQDLEVGRLTGELAAVLLVRANLVLIVPRSRSRVGRESLAQAAHQCVQEDHDVATREALPAARRLPPGSVQGEG